jgi:hypothetical protein
MSTQNESMNTPAPATPAAAPLSFTVSAPVLRAALSACAPAMSIDPNRHIISSLYFELSAATPAAQRTGSAPHVLSLVATDGRRMHVAQIPIDGLSLPAAPARCLAFIMPAASVRAAIKACFPKKLKAGEARLTFTPAAGGAPADQKGLRWLAIKTEAGELTCPETFGNYPMFRQVIPSNVAARGAAAVHINRKDALNVAEINEAEDARFNEACLNAAVSAAASQSLPFPAEQIRRAALPSVRKLIKDARKRSPLAYFESAPAGRLIPLALSFAHVPPSFMFNADASNVSPLGAADIRLTHAAGMESCGSDVPRAARVAINPEYLADVAAACAAFETVPGSSLNGALSAADESSPFVIRTCADLDAGERFTFLAVIMPARMR